MMLTLLALVGFAVAGQTFSQMLLGVKLSAGEVVAYVAPFVTLGLIAVGFLASILRSITPAKR